jgi:hypothetical protein
VDEPGQAAQALRLHLTYDRPAEAPATLIAKVAAAHAPIREVADGAGYYRREVRFYTELAHEVAVPTPRCYFGAYDPEQHAFLLLLEDLGSGRLGSFASDFDDSVSALQAIARMHAAWWKSERLAALRWAPGLSHPAARSGLVAHVQRALSALESRDLYPVNDYVLGVLREFVESPDRVFDRLLAQPATLTHGDFQPLNLFHSNGGGGRFAVIDWQVVETAFAGCDVSRFVVAACSPELRRVREQPILEAYRSTLAHAGVEIGAAALEEQYDLGIATYVLKIIPTLASWEPEAARRVDRRTGETFLDITVGRLQQAAQERDIARLWR